MQTEQSGDTNSKAAVAQQPKTTRNKSKKPKPATIANNKENSSAVNEETTVNAPQTPNSTIKKKKKRNNNKKKLATTGEKTENLISQTFKAAKLQNADNQLLCNGLEQNSIESNNSNSVQNSEHQNLLNKNQLFEAIAKVGKPVNSEKRTQNSEASDLNNSSGTHNSIKTKKKKNRKLKSSQSSAESTSKSSNNPTNLEPVSPRPLSSKSTKENSGRTEEIGKIPTNQTKKDKISDKGKRNRGLEQASRNNRVGSNTELVEEHKENVVISKNNTSTVTTGMDTVQKEKSREDILAAREAKKLAKLNAKKGIKNQATIVKNDVTPVVLSDSNSNPVKKAISNDVKAKDSQKTTLPGIANQKTEKSREEILVERKRLAKLAAKNKNESKVEDGEQTKVIKGTKESKKPPPSADETDFSSSKIVNVNILANNLENIHLSESEGQKKKPTTKAERRAIQEAQREAKAKLLSEKQQTQKAVPAKGDALKKEAPVKTIPVENRKAEKTAIITSPCKLRPFKVKFFNQLETKIEEQNLFVNNPQIHPAMVKLGEQYAKRIVVGSNARCIAFLNALKMVIEDYVTPPKKEFSRGLEGNIKNCVDHLQKCRPLAVSVSNAYKYIKVVLTKLPPNQPESELKKHLVELIDIYIKDQIEKAAQAISYNVQESISNGDVILTYGCSSLITHILEEAHRREIDFRVIVVDSRPFDEGQELLRRLVAKGISCTCVLINAIGFVMAEATKVLLGAHALLANGYVVSRIGTAQVALVARSFNVSVFVCCEKHKFSERTQTDAIVYNELGNPNDLISKTKDCRLMDWKTFPSLYPLNLNYDVTPPELVNVVVTEVTLMPSTSAPVILRIRPNEMLS